MPNRELGTSVGQPGGRPLSFCGRPDQSTATPFARCARPCTTVDRDGRPFSCFCRRSTGRSTVRLLGAVSAAAAELSGISGFRHSSTLPRLPPPTILHLGEDFSNLSRSPTNPSHHLAKSTHDLDEIDTRSRLEICSSAIHWKASHMPSLHFTLGELPYMPITERGSSSATSRPHEELIMSQH